MAIDATTAGLATENEVVTSNASICLTDISAGYWHGQPVLDGVSLILQRCGWFHLAAPNGAGKSTLFEVLAGYLQPTSGKVSVGGEPVLAGTRVTALRLQRSRPGLVPGITMRDHLHLYARRYGAPLDTLLKLTHTLGMDEHLAKPPEALSTGTVKKLWFVCHAAGDEPVWCLDEPFDGVDVESAAVMAAHLGSASSDRLVLITSHVLPAGVEADEPPLSAGAPFVLKELRHV